jgi:NAD(P)-dependent dehydrogenase (short-subunit alcohol dehydrogenase family)
MKNIVVVGAGRGIGLATVKALQNENLFTISHQLTNELADFNTAFYPLDAAKDDLALLADLPEVIHGIVYCPGSINLRPFNRLTAQDFLNDFQQNVLGAIAVIQYLLARLKKADGASIVLFSSVAVKMGMPFHASIAAAKGAVEGLAKSLAAELATSKIRVNVIAPSLTDTPLASALLSSDEKREAAAKRHPLNSIGSADEIGQLVAFLIQDNSRWITGQVIGVDGGIGSLK